MGLPPPPMQPEPNADQFLILQLIANHVRTDPDYKGRFLHDLLAVQSLTFFRQRAARLDNYFGPGIIRDIQLQLSRNPTGQERAYLDPFVNVEHDVVRFWLQDRRKCSEHTRKELMLTGRSHSRLGIPSSR